MTTRSSSNSRGSRTFGLRGLIAWLADDERSVPSSEAEAEAELHSGVYEIGRASRPPRLAALVAALVGNRGEGRDADSSAAYALVAERPSAPVEARDPLLPPRRIRKVRAA